MSDEESDFELRKRSSKFAISKDDDDDFSEDEDEEDEDEYSSAAAGDGSTDDSDFERPAKAAKSKAGKSAPEKGKKSSAKGKDKDDNKKTSAAAPKGKSAKSSAGKLSKSASSASTAASSASGGAVKVLSEKDSLPAILEYMISQNRPYSVQNVFDNLHGKVKKALVPKILDKLVADNKLQVKEYGKARIYLGNQDQYPEVSKEELEQMDNKNAELKESLNLIVQQVDALEKELALILSEPTDQEIEREIEENSRLISDLDSKLEGLLAISSTTTLVSEDELKSKQKQVAQVLSEWKRRKRICTDMVEAVSEGLEKKPRELMEELGCEFDEDYNADIALIRI